ncbi:MAG: hypothetical protein OEZ04_06085 [Nitrospinota bacterium]|nr:hypothetical protein [Nitrospinota bacterium]
MPVDLRVHSLASRKSLLVMEDSLVMLEHSQFSDRIHKILYESIESIIVWKKLPWLKMTLTALALGGFAYIPFIGTGSLANNDTRIYLLIVLGVFVALETILLIRKKVFIRINHSGLALDLAFSAFPWKVSNFVDKVRTQAEKRQITLRKKRNEAKDIPDIESGPDHSLPPVEDNPVR